MADNIPSYNDILGGGIGEPGRVISHDVVFESVVLDESINGDGGLTIGWNSTTGGGLAAGTAYSGYILMSPYLPTRNSDGSYRYDVKFSDPVALLGKKLFYRNVRLADGSTMPLYTFSITAQAGTLLSALSEAAGSGYTVTGENIDSTTAVTVSFDGDTVKSAATKIADALGVSVWYTPGTIHIGTAGSYQSGEYYDSFVVLGGTKNMTKKITTSEGEEYAAVTKRLTLDPGQYPGSKMGSGTMEKILIFDNIYPKARFRITEANHRDCWLLNEDGERIPTEYVTDPVTHEQVATDWAKYSKWYVRLADADAEAGSADAIDLDDIEIVDGEVLRMQFLPTADGGNSVLAGREFELVRFTTQATERSDDDVDSTGYIATPGEFRIVMGAEGGTVLPSTVAQGIYPSAGDLVTLVNIRVPDVCYDRARSELAAAARTAMNSYSGAPQSYTEDGGSASLGAVSGSYICTAVHTDLITGERQVTWGTLAQKGLLTSLIDKVDGVQTAGGGGTTGEDSGQHVAIMSKDQWDALANAGGHLGMVTVNNRIDGLSQNVEDFGADLNAVEQQADKRMDLFFAAYAPHPNSATDSAAPTLPNSGWATEEYAQHEEDIFYNTNREAADPFAGRAWRWMWHDVEGTRVYWWDEITDADTLLSIEKASDVAWDGKICGGTEKVRLWTDYCRISDEHAKFAALFDSNDNVYWEPYDAAYTMLVRALNGGATPVIGPPAWLQNLDETTAVVFPATFLEYLSGEGIVPDTDYEEDIAAASREVYRILWQQYNEKACDIDEAIKSMAKTANTKVVALASDLVLSAGTEKQQILTEWLSARTQYRDLLEQAGDYWEGSELTNKTSGINTAWNALWRNLGQRTNYNAQNDTAVIPLYIRDTDGGTLNEDTVLTSAEAASYRNAWVGWYNAVTGITALISDAQNDNIDNAQTAAESAAAHIDDMVSDTWLTPSEKKELQEEYVAALNRFYRDKGLDDRARDSSDDYYPSVTVDGKSYNVSACAAAWGTAFNVLSRYLDNQSTYGSDNTDWASAFYLDYYYFGNEVTTDSNDLPSLILNHLDTPTQLSSPGTLRALWRALADAEDAMEAAIEKVTRYQADAAHDAATSAQTYAATVSSRVDNIEADNIISKGSEKTQLYVKWQDTVAEFWRIIALAEDYDLHLVADTVVGGVTTYSAYKQYVSAYSDVLVMLNGGNTISLSTVIGNDGKVVRDNSLLNGTTTPAWLVNLSADTTMGFGATEYRSRWSGYAESREALTLSIQQAVADSIEAAATGYTTDASIVRSMVAADVVTVQDLESLWQIILGQLHDVWDGAGIWNNTLSNGTSALASYVSAWEDALLSFCAYLNGASEWDSYDDCKSAPNGTTGVVTFDFDSLTPPDYIESQHGFTISTEDASQDDDFASYTESLFDAKKSLDQAYSAHIIALINAAGSTATSAQTTANNVRTDVNAIISDGVLSRDEKIDVLKEWKVLAATHNQNLALASRIGFTGDSVHHTEEIDGEEVEITLWDYYFNALWTLGMYLNGDDETGDEWSYANQYRVLTDSDIPDWLTNGVNTSITRSRYITLWTNYYQAEKEFVDAINELIKALADTANTRLDQIADDGYIVEFEKNDLMSQWKAWAGEYASMHDSAGQLGVLGETEFTDYQVAMRNLANFLDAPGGYSAIERRTQKVWIESGEFTFYGTSATSIAAFVPLMLTVAATYQLTSTQKENYAAVLLGFRRSRTALLARLSVSASVKLFVSEEKPAPPFYIGDRWLWKGHDGEGNAETGTDTMMYCVQSNTDSTDTNYTVADYWKPYAEVFSEIERDARPTLAALGDKLFSLYGSSASNFPVTVVLSDSGHSATPAVGTATSDSDVASLLSALYDIIGAETFYVRLSLPAGVVPDKYDLLCTPVTCVIPGSQETVTGGITVQWYNGSRWEYIQQSTSSLLENLGTKILAMVFGSNDAATEAAGLDVGQRFAKLFAMAQVYDPDTQEFVTLSQALFGLSVDVYYRYIYDTRYITKAEYDSLSDAEKEDYYKVGYKSSAKMSADKINFSASQNFITAVGNAARGLKLLMQHEDTGSTFTLGYYNGSTFRTVFSFDSNGKLNLSAGSATIDASVLAITSGGTTTAVFQNGTIRAQFIDVASLFAGTINAENATMQNLHVTGNSTFEGEVTGIVNKHNNLLFIPTDDRGTANNSWYHEFETDGNEPYGAELTAEEMAQYGVTRQVFVGTGDADIVFFRSTSDGSTVYIAAPADYPKKTVVIYNATSSQITIDTRTDGTYSNPFKVSYRGDTIGSGSLTFDSDVQKITLYSDGRYWYILEVYRSSGLTFQ